MSGGPLVFEEKTHGLTPQPTAETELVALEAVYLSNFMLESVFETYSFVPINCGITGDLRVEGNATYMSRTKLIALRFFFLHELVKTAKVVIHHVGTGNMLADVATQYLGKVKHDDVLCQIVEFPL